LATSPFPVFKHKTLAILCDLSMGSRLLCRPQISSKFVIVFVCLWLCDCGIMGWWASGFALCVLVGPWVSARACAFVFACAPCVLTSACGSVGLLVFGRWCVCSWLACSGLCAWGVNC
jgi:hypothetical protein